MHMMTADLRRAIEKEGAPLPVIDTAKGRAYILVEARFSPARPDGVRATLPGISAIGEGDAPDDALIALTHALRSIASLDN
jgi:hypothetical protein